MDQTGRILSVPPVGERMAPHPALSPSDGEREKTRWEQGRARPLTPTLSPSDGGREKRDCAAAGGTDKMRPPSVQLTGGLCLATLRPW